MWDTSSSARGSISSFQAMFLPLPSPSPGCSHRTLGILFWTCASMKLSSLGNDSFPTYAKVPRFRAVITDCDLSQALLLLIRR